MANSFHRIKKGLSLIPTVLPVSGEVGDIACDISDNEIKRWDGLSWVKVGSGGGVIVVADITGELSCPVIVSPDIFTNNGLRLSFVKCILVSPVCILKLGIILLSEPIKPDESTVKTPNSVK